MKRVFIFSQGKRWFGIARLPKALKDAGFEVVVLCPRDSVLALTQYIDELYVYDSYREYMKLMKRIVRNSELDLIIPGGDDEVLYLNQLLQSKTVSKKTRQRLQLLAYGEGNHQVLGNKSTLQDFASSLGIRTPENRILESEQQLREELEKRNYPIVLKSDFGAAGDGVRICQSEEEALKGYHDLIENRVSISLSTKLKERIKKSLDLPVYFFKQSISIQNYVSGTPCMHGIFASKGEVLSAVTLLKTECFPEVIGPSCVIEAIQHDQIANDVLRMVSETKYTGFGSFDYIIDKDNNASLLECNPRPTPVMHLTHLLGGNLVEMIKKHLGEESVSPAYTEAVHPLIALFPNELKRDAESKYLKTAYHDVPEEDPELMKFFDRELEKYNIPPLKA